MSSERQVFFFLSKPLHPEHSSWQLLQVLSRPPIDVELFSPFLRTQPFPARITRCQFKRSSRFFHWLSYLVPWGRLSLKKPGLEDFVLNRVAGKLEGRSEKSRPFAWLLDQESWKLAPALHALGFQILFQEEGLPPRSLAALGTVVVRSDVEAARMRRALKRDDAVVLVPHAVDEKLLSEPFRSAPHLLVVARQREDAEWFLTQVYSRVGRKLPPSTRIDMTAPTLPKSLTRALLQQGIRLRRPDSETSLRLESQILCFPQLARRLDGKCDAPDAKPILDAMALGKVVFTSGFAAEGLTLSPTYDAFVSDRPDAWASDLLKVLTEPDFAATVGSRARNTAQTRYAEAHLRVALDGLLV